MTRIESMLRNHPQQENMKAEMVQCIEACIECGNACNTCADACLGEEMIDKLRRCISLNLDCADLCQAAERTMSRQTVIDSPLIDHLVRALTTICGDCAEECERHAKLHEHCRICAEACRECEDACRAMI